MWMVKDQPSNEHKQFHDGREKKKKNDKTNHADANRESFVTKGASARALTHTFDSVVVPVWRCTHRSP